VFFARGLPPNGIGFLARRSVGRAKLLLSRIPAASVSSIPAAPQKRWQTLTARTSVQRLGWSLAHPGLHPSFHRISEKAKAIGLPPCGSLLCRHAERWAEALVLNRSSLCYD
jgi:hypothetical protein